MANKQTDNSDLEAKQMIREWALNKVGGPKKASVLELYGGMGHIYDACYTEVPKHMAFELRKVNRPGWIQGDNRTLLRTRVNGWNLYDLDAYASPWMLANDICRMRDPGKFVMVFTCGIFRSLNTGTLNGFVRQRVNLNGMTNLHTLISRFYMDIIEYLMLDWSRWGVEVLEAKHIRSAMTHKVHYFAAEVKKTAPLKAKSA